MLRKTLTILSLLGLLLSVGLWGVRSHRVDEDQNFPELLRFETDTQARRA